VLPVDLEALVPVHADLYRQVLVLYAPIDEPDLREPAVRAKLLDEPGAEGLYLPAPEADRVEQVARVPQDIVAPERSAFGLPSGLLAISLASITGWRASVMV
jgi:hypothetical protein